MRIFDRSLILFLVIGVGNTLISFVIMQAMYALGWGGYFALVIAVCYLLAYSAARPATIWLLNKLAPGGILPVGNDQIAMLVGQVLFTGLNYLGQRFFAFKAPGARRN